MRNANRIILSTVLVTFVGWTLVVESSVAQDDARRALIGAWEGTVTQGTASAPTRLEFSEQGDKLVWKWNWDASFAKGEAEGTVTKYVPPSVELNGRYISHTSMRVRNSPITMSLTLSGNQLQGNGLTAVVNTVFSLSVTKKAPQ